MPRQVLDFDHPLVRFMRQDVRTDTSTTDTAAAAVTTTHEVPHHHASRHKEHERRGRYLRHLARDERRTDDRLAQYRAFFRLEEAERIGADGETSCPCNRDAVLEQLRLNHPEVIVYASVGSPYVEEAPPVVDLTEEPKGRAKVAHVAKKTPREEVRRMKDQKRSITAVPTTTTTTTTTTTSIPRQVLVDFDHPLVRFMRQVVRTDTSTTTTHPIKPF